MRINHYFDNNLSFLTIISLGLHNMVNHECPSDIMIATHNIIGFGIKTLTSFPIDSSNSLEMSLISIRHQFWLFIKNVVESKINTHLTNHGPDPSLSPVLRSAVALESYLYGTSCETTILSRTALQHGENTLTLTQYKDYFKFNYTYDE